MGNLHLVTGYAGNEHVTAADHGAFNAALIGTGQFVLEKGNVFEAQVISNNQVRVLDGELMMQGRFVRLNPSTYVDLVIENGAQNVKRHDLIVARYTKSTRTGVESVDLVVIRGEAVESDPVDPAFTEGDITNGEALLNEFPLWRIPLDGLNVGEPERLFVPFIDSMRTLPNIRQQVMDIHAEVDAQLAEYDVAMEEKIAGIESYLKDEVLTDETKALYGLASSAVPNDVFTILADKKTIENLAVEKIKASTTWKVPAASGQQFVVMAVGGGGSGGCGSSDAKGGSGGGGGYIEIETLTLPENAEIDIVCGAGGAASSSSSRVGKDGGTTLFGDYLTAEGGKGGGYGSTGGGGDGGAGGGGYSNWTNAKGGNGGTYGGGGGGYTGGNGGTYGGNGGSGGGSATVLSEKGVVSNVSVLDVLLDVSKIDITFAIGTKNGGGGFCGSGGTGGSYGCGGGGGYCGNGGNGGTNTGGGGGGLFANGGNGHSSGNTGGGGAGIRNGDDGSSSGGGKGGSGGVIIVYFKE